MMRDWTETYKDTEGGTAITNPIKTTQSNMASSTLETINVLEIYKKMAQRYYTQYVHHMAQTHSLPQDKIEHHEKKTIEIGNKYAHAQYDVTMQRNRLMLEILKHSDDIIIPTAPQSKKANKQWGNVTYNRYAQKDGELLYELQPESQFALKNIPYDKPQQFIKQITQKDPELSQYVHNLLKQIMWYAPKNMMTKKVIELVALGAQQKYTHFTTQRMNVGNNPFQYPKPSLQTCFVIRSTEKVVVPTKKEGKKVKKALFEIVIGDLDMNICLPWHNPATNHIVRHSIHKCMHDIMKKGHTEEGFSSVLTGICVKITEFQEESVGESHPSPYDAQVHELHIRPFSGPDQCHASNIYFKNTRKVDGSVYGILNNNVHTFIPIDTDSYETRPCENSIHAYIMQNSKTLEEYQLSHINVTAHLNTWIKDDHHFTKSNLIRRLEEKLKVDSDTPDQPHPALDFFKTTRINFPNWDLIASTMTDDRGTAHTVITAVNYSPTARFPPKVPDLDPKITRKPNIADNIHLPRGIWWEFRYATGTIEEILKENEANPKNHKHSIFYWDFDPNRTPTYKIQKLLQKLRRELFDLMKGQGWPYLEDFHEALLKNEHFLATWQELLRGLFINIVIDSLKYLRYIANKTDDTEMPPSDIKITCDQGFLFSIPFDTLDNVLANKAQQEHPAHASHQGSHLAKPIIDQYKHSITQRFTAEKILEATQKYNPEEQYERGRSKHHPGSTPSSRSNSTSRSNASTRSRDSSPRRHRKPARNMYPPYRGNLFQRNQQYANVQRIRAGSVSIHPASTSSELAPPMMLGAQTRHEENNAILLKELLKRLDKQT